MELIQLRNTDHPAFSVICTWNYEWWGKKMGFSLEKVKEQMAHSLLTGRNLPQTFVAMDEEKPVGMFQIAMYDDLDIRPDIYPWLRNVYVDEQFRGKGIGRFLLERVPEVCKSAHIGKLHLYTHHVGLYEKFGWHYIETIRFEEIDERYYSLAISPWTRLREKRNKDDQK